MRTLWALAILLAATLSLTARADEKPAKTIGWKMHTINAQSEFPACAAFDVDHDGDIDIYSGGWWYEAPKWTKHKVRDVEVIRGRFDDYSNQPQDCNGDGWTDIISVNYRSETIYWIEHPGKNLGKQDWTAHVIDKPGPSETGRLHDIDGDGDLDILPNGTTYAAWYEFKPEKKDGGLLEPKWVKHDLPKEAAGHGIGFVKTRTAELLVSQSQLFRPNHRGIPRESYGALLADPFGEPPSIHRDASVPILWQQSRRLLVWGRGHSTGLYSTYGTTGREGEPYDAWQAIDTSWSQCHAPLLADVDNDGRDDVVAGKRYMGHEGKDPGEYDLSVIYWYSFNSDRNIWQRHVIHFGGPGGIDLDGKAFDIDVDGDLDIVAPSRNGLYLFENLLVNRQQVKPTVNDGTVLAPYSNHSQLMLFATEQDLRPVKTQFEWAQRRWHILRSMEQVMGELPAPSSRNVLQLVRKETVEQPKYSRVEGQLQSHIDDLANLTFTLLIPKAVHDMRGARRAPAMLCLHPTSIPHGKKLVTGQEAKENRAYAHELAERGYVCICPDYPTMGENPFDLKTTHKHYQSGTMKAIWDNIRCLDVLESLPYVDPDRIGVIGHSLGGHNGLFTACFDQRIKCVVTSCGFTPFHDYYGGKLDGWTQDRYMPRIREVYENNPDKMPFDFYEVLGAIAPRPIFINAPLHDDNFDVGGVKKCVAEAQKVYDLLGKKDGITARYPDDKHDFPEKERMEAYEWLDKQLK